MKGSAHAGGRRAFLPQGSDPLNQSRTYATLHAAIHDALNAVHQRYEFYTPGTTHPLYHMMFDLQGVRQIPAVGELTAAGFLLY